MAASVLVVLFLGYRYYGRFIARQYALDDSRDTPAVKINDGIDFVPTRPFYLLGQHFSAIAAAGPIAGPILAAQQFGWLPALLWICVGVVFIGAVHDLSTLIASIRHGGGSIAEVIREQLGPGAGITMMAFIWLALVYVIVAFTDVTVSTFVAGDPDLAGLKFEFNQGGAVAVAATLYLLLAIVMGLVERYLKPKLWLQTILFVPAAIGVVWIGTKLSTLLVFGPVAWAVLILAYCFVASLTPVWLLLQPRGYLGGFVLYLALAIGVIGIFFGGFDIQLPAFKGFEVPGASGMLFPFLFVTIACGACSGFHGLVCSGTTSKQISKESHCHPVGYGAMLMEGFVAVIALATVMIATGAETAGKPAGTVYGIGIGRFVAVLLGPEHLPLAITFGAMAFSTFVFDTLDVSTRLGRYILQELFGLKGKVGAAIGTGLTVGVPLLFLLAAEPGSYKKFWVLFGTSNQMLAALSLMGITVWLKRSNKRYWYTLWPMLFVSAITFTSLMLQVAQAFFGANSSLIQKINGGVAAVLFVLAATLMTQGTRALLQKPLVSAAATS